MTDVNRANWDVWAAAHGQDDYYDRAGLVAGGDSLTDIEWAGVRAAIGSVEGRDVLHVQCHIGFDSVTLTRHGARVTGVDFSPVALRKAAELAAECGVDVEWVEADTTDLPASLNGRFDLAYATIGILCWIGDVDAWMRSVARTLRPGGRLLLIDGHPLCVAIDRLEPLELGFPYAYDGPHTFTSEGSYAAGAASEATTNVQYAHSLGEIVTAAADAGLAVMRLVEHLDWPLLPPGAGAVRDPDGRWRLHLGGQDLPVLFTLIAEKPAPAAQGSTGGAAGTVTTSTSSA
jgi:SAM-dependent methyltransferase